MIRRRAEMLARARAFFAARGVLEVDTPILGHGLVVEAHIDPVPCSPELGGRRVERHLLTSPEGPMKRLLAQGSGPIYQFAPAFRDGESGSRHRPEFTLLEWYRPGFDALELMDEVEDLVRALVPAVGGARFAKKSYRDVFLDAAGIDPFATPVAGLRSACARHDVDVPAGVDEADELLDLLLVSVVEPTLDAPVFVYDYPASQAALARVHQDAHGDPVAARFELYIRGLELCNGYHELSDPIEQRRRFEAANRIRQARGRPALPVDEALLEALAGGSFPDCAGVALGFDRLLMVATGASDIGEVRPADDRSGV